jgi:nitrite reductase (NADH) small subunit
MYDLATTISKFLGKGAVEITSHFVHVADADEVPPGGRKIVQVGEDSILLFNIGGAYYAIHNSCPHQGWPLVHGHLDGEVLTCSLHNWQFNLKDGSSPLSDDIKARVYPAKVEGSSVMIAI